MTPKIIAHNEELQRLDRAGESNSKDFKYSLEGKTTADTKKDRLSRVSRGSQPYSPDAYLEKPTTYYSPFQESPNKVYEIPKQEAPLGSEDEEHEEIVNKMLDYLEI